MASKGFFRAIEIWTPVAGDERLELASGLYDDLPYFEAVSRGMTMARSEGLPGKAWTAGHPIILDDLRNSYFRRGEAASAEALSCAIALPIFIGARCTAVLILFFGDDRYQRGAVEIWHAPGESAQLRLAGGYFGRAGHLARASRDTAFARGQGVPGKAWQSGGPVIVSDVGADDAFARRESADQLLIDRAVGIPCSSRDGAGWLVTFVSVRNSPLARRIESWVPGADGDIFALAAGYCENTGALPAMQQALPAAPGNGLFAAVRSTGVPVICKDLARLDEPFARAAHKAGLTSAIVMPIFTAGRCTAVLAWYP